MQLVMSFASLYKTILSTLRKAQFGQTLRYFEFLTSSFTRVNSGVKISKSLDFAQIHTFRSRLNLTQQIRIYHQNPQT